MQCLEKESVISFHSFVERKFELVTQVFIILPVQHIKAIFECFRVGIHKCSKKTVPQGKDVAVITVGIRTHIMVMHFVHIGRYENPANGPVQPFRYYDVGMIKIREYGRTTAVEKIQPYGHSHYQHANNHR